MKNSLVILLVFVVSQGLYGQQQDAEGSKDHPMFPNRMANYVISEYSNNFDAADFNLAESASKVATKEGTKTSINYSFDHETGKQMPSVLQILRNYESASKKIGGTTLFLNVNEQIAVFKIAKGEKEVWIKIEPGANGAENYILTIVEVEAMKQEITSNDILTALNTDGYIALYINFDTGKSEIKTESQPIIDQLTEMMTSNPTLKISIEGHTDNVGASEANKTLSVNRAKAVMNALFAKSISASRLSSVGWGQEKPIADNRTEDGKAKNRRVEIIKK